MKQLVRYAVVGLASNFVGYLVYLGVTGAGLEPKLAVTLLYGVGVTISFLGNRRWTFRHQGNVSTGAVRFAIAHFLGYLINLSLLIVFAERLGYSHQLVQAAAIFVVAGFLFVLFRLFVFRNAAGEQAL